MSTVDSSPLRERLVAAGVELLEEDGLAELTLRAIARRAGVSHGAPRRYFPTHNALLAAIAATGLADLAARMTPPEGDQPAEERLVRLGLSYLEFAAERPAMFELIFRHDLLAGAGGNLRQTSVPLFGTIIALVEEAVPQDARERTIALWTNLHGLATLRAAHTLDLVYPDGGVEHLVPKMVRAHLS
ncbi:TetR family transcriptional regulator [Kribbella sp. VKM Ac-2568]|nr:TetR family transcriptional regulator [Kribbella sp. VKM Ac-2568]